MATDRKVRVRLEAAVGNFVKGMGLAQAAVGSLRKEINTTNDRTAWLAQGILALGPALVPLGAAGVPAVAGLATQLGLATVAAGTAALAFNGVGDALQALNTYQLEPTAAHLEKLNQTMAAIGPEGAEFVRFLDSVGPAFSALANASRRELFPGVEDGIRVFVDDLLPRLQVVVEETASAMGQLTREAGIGLAGPEWERFFEFLQTEAQPLLLDMGRTVGNLATGFANLVVEFSPLTERFSRGLLRMSRSFAEWSENLDDNASFQEFLTYIQEVTPRVLDLFEALIDAAVALIQAAAPVGAIMLPAFTALFKVIEAIAETPLGPIFLAAAAAASIYGRAVALAEITTGNAMGKITQRTRANAKEALKARFAWRDLGNAMTNAALSQKQLDQRATWGPLGERSATRAKEARANMAAYGKSIAGTGAQLGLLGIAMTDLDDKMGLSNTALLALMGSMGGPWGAAAGAAVGLTLDFAHANDDLVASIERANVAAKGSDLNRMLEEQAALRAKIAAYDKDRSNTTGVGDFFSGAWEWLSSDDDYNAARRRVDGMQSGIDELRVSLSKGVILEHGGDRGQGAMFRELATDAEAAEVAMSGLGDQLRNVQGLLDRSGSLIAYEQALDDFTQSIEDNGNAWDVGTEKGRNNLEARNTLVEKAILRAQALKEVGDDLGAQRILHRAIEDLGTFIGDSEGARKRALKPLKDALWEIDHTNAKPKITLNNKQAMGEISEVNTALGALERHARRLRLDHMEIRLGDTYADGGYTGHGKKYEPAGIVHRGEFVFDAETTKRNIGLFQAIHKGMGGYAHGGYVAASSQPSAAAFPGMDYDRLAAAMLSARQVYGDVIVNGDPTVWRKQMEDDDRARSTGALR